MRRRTEFHFSIQRKNVKTPDFAYFVAALLRRYGKILLILDRWSVHRAAVRLLSTRYPKRLSVLWLPPYAPDVNPVEQVWAHTKHGELANFIPDDLDHLQVRLRHKLENKHRWETLHRTFFNHAGLPL